MVSKKQQQIQWRRERVFDYYAAGYLQSEIADKLQVERWIICRDMAYIKRQAKFHLKSYLEEKLPIDLETTIAGLTAILKRSLQIADTTEDNREKIQALSLARDTYSTRMSILTDINVVDDIIKMVGDRKNKLLLLRQQDRKARHEKQIKGQIQNQEETSIITAGQQEQQQQGQQRGQDQEESNLPKLLAQEKEPIDEKEEESTVTEEEEEDEEAVF